MILRGGRGRPNCDPEGVAAALERLRGAGLAERLVIDASHDNSAKDPARQLAAAAAIGEQVAAGNGAIVGVMLESFLVEGRQDLGGGEPLDLRPVDHRPLHRLGAHRDRAGGAGRRRCGARRETAS